MHTLLIIDDEVIVTQSLLKNIQWDTLDIDEVSISDSAEEALTLLPAHTFDIIISDIMMPGMNGLEFAEQLVKHNNTCKIIFMTGYSEFSYAKKAIDLGAFAFLTKPVSYEEIEKTVVRAIEELENEERLSLDSQQMQTLYANALPFITERLLFHWLSEDRDEAMEQLIQLHSMPSDFPTDFQAMLIGIEAEVLPTLSYMDIQKIEIHVKEIVPKIISFECECRIFSDTQGMIFFLYLSKDAQMLKSIATQIHHKAPQIHSLQIANGLVHTLLYISSVVPVTKSAQIFKEIYLQAKSRNRELLKDMTITIELHDETEACENHLSTILSILNRYPSYKTLLASSQKEAILERIEEISCVLATVTQECTMFKIIYIHVTHNILKTAEEAYIEIERLLQYERDWFFSITRQTKSVDSLIQYIRHFSCKLCDLIAQTTLVGHNSIINRTTEYIRDMIETPISITNLANHLGIHPNYLSTLFKKQMGQTLQDYIGTHKMAHAKNLLLSTDLHIGEISRRLGYENTSSFNRAFKKYVHISPKYYRKII